MRRKALIKKLNFSGSALVATLIAVSAVATGIFYIFMIQGQTGKMTDLDFGRLRSKLFVDLVHINLGSSAICTQLLASGDFVLDGGALNKVAAAPDGVGQKLTLNSGLKDAANNVILIQDNAIFDQFSAKITSFRFHCADAACSCIPVYADTNGDGVPEPTGVCQDFSSVDAGIQPRIPGELRLGMESINSNLFIPIKTQIVELNLQLDAIATANVTSCVSEDSPITVCNRLGGIWTNGAKGPYCKMPLPNFVCPPNKVAAVDVNGDGVPECVNYTQNCGPNQYVTGIVKGVATCASVGYTWVTSAWGPCTEFPVGVWTQSRSVACVQSSDGIGSAPANCIAWHNPLPAPVTSKACTGCSAQAVNWTVGVNTCNANAPSVVTGGNSGSLVDATGPATGQASFTCVAGIYTEDGGASCDAPVVPPSDCSAQVVSWSVGGVNCSGGMLWTADGSSAAVSSSGPNIGNASFLCVAGVPTEEAGSTCSVPVSRDCGAQVLSWTVGANTCSTAAPATADTIFTGSLMDAAGPETGQANFLCNNTAFQLQPGATCDVPPADCLAQNVSWTVGGRLCGANLAATLHGNSAVATDNVGTTGTATFSCSNGVLSELAGSTCLAAPRPPRCADLNQPCSLYGLNEGDIGPAVDECGCFGGWDVTYKCVGGLLAEHVMPCYGFDCPRFSMCR